MPNPHRDGFATLRAGALNWESFPLRLFAKGNAKFWNPADIDMSHDAADWQSLDDMERLTAIVLSAQFVAGEEAVTQDLQPFMGAMAAEGRLGDEMYLTQFCFEEAKHVAVFRRWLDTVGVLDDLHGAITENAGYRALLYEELPASLNALHDDPSPANQVRASVTYNHIVEGTLALTGYFAWQKICRTRGIFPGMQEIVRRIGDDERRHMAWGTFTCRRHVAADDANWQVVVDRFEELMPDAVATVRWGFDLVPEVPFGLDVDELLGYAKERADRRLRAIASARGVPVAQIDIDASPERLEEEFAAEDDEFVHRAVIG